MKYKFLTVKGSIQLFRILLLFISIIALSLLINTIATKAILPLFFVILILVFLIFPVFKFSVVKYNINNIVVENIYGRTTYLRNDFLSIEAVTDFLDIYVIKFKDGKKFFLASPRRIGFSWGSKKYATKMQMEIRKDYNYLSEIESIMKDFESNHPDELASLRNILETTISSTESLMHTTHFLLAMKSRVKAETLEKILNLKEYCNSIGVSVIVE